MVRVFTSATVLSQLIMVAGSCAPKGSRGWGYKSDHVFAVPELASPFWRGFGAPFPVGLQNVSRAGEQPWVAGSTGEDSRWDRTG
jgi:hypothetical protein